MGGGSICHSAAANCVFMKWLVVDTKSDFGLSLPPGLFKSGVRFKTLSFPSALNKRRIQTTLYVRCFFKAIETGRSGVPKYFVVQETTVVTD